MVIHKKMVLIANGKKGEGKKQKVCEECKEPASYAGLRSRKFLCLKCAMKKKKELLMPI
jgi:hypothetical protein